MGPPVYALIDFFAMHGYLLGSRESKAHKRALYTEHGYGDFIANLHRLSQASGQNEHKAASLISVS
jgi:hypothetical protein